MKSLPFLFFALVCVACSKDSGSSSNSGQAANQSKLNKTPSQEEWVQSDEAAIPKAKAFVSKYQGKFLHLVEETSTSYRKDGTELSQRSKSRHQIENESVCFEYIDSSSGAESDKKPQVKEPCSDVLTLQIVDLEMAIAKTQKNPKQVLATTYNLNKNGDLALRFSILTEKGGVTFIGSGGTIIEKEGELVFRTQSEGLLSEGDLLAPIITEYDVINDRKFKVSDEKVPSL